MPTCSSLQVNISSFCSEYECKFVLLVGRHDSEDLKKIAVEKIRNNKKIMSDPAFKKKVQDNQDILIDLLEEFIQ